MDSHVVTTQRALVGKIAKQGTTGRCGGIKNKNISSSIEFSILPQEG